MRTVNARITVYGRVQMVGFRYFAMINAEKLKIKGYVRNNPNGTVEIVASAEDSAFREFYAVVSKGPSSAVVDDVDIQYNYAPAAECENFQIK